MFATLVQLHMKFFVLRADKNYVYDVHPPGELDPLILREITLFRVKQYESRSPYLLTPSQFQIENKLMIDQRSYHIVARRKSDGELVGALRLTPYPFELTSLLPETLSVLGDRHKLEIGRLIVDASVRNVGKKLMMLAGVFAVEETDYEGFIGVCRCDKLEYFRKFGMKVRASEVELRGRPGNYSVIFSDFDTMRSSVLKNFVSRLTANPLKKRDEHERLP